MNGEVTARPGSMTAAEFIAARLAEDERIASDPRPDWKIENWHIVRYKEGVRNYRVDAEPRCVADGAFEEDAAHIARHDPARVLREVAAKRAILAEHPRVWPHPDGPRRCSRCVNTGVDGIMRLKEWPCPTVRHLAAIWQEHPDYDESWRP